MSSDANEVVGSKSNERNVSTKPDGAGVMAGTIPTPLCNAVNPKNADTCTFPEGHHASDGCHFGARSGLWYVARMEVRGE